MNIEEEDMDVVSRQQKSQSSSAASSDLSPILSHALFEKEPTPVPEPKPASAKCHDRDGHLDARTDREGAETSR